MTSLRRTVLLNFQLFSKISLKGDQQKKKQWFGSFSFFRKSIVTGVEVLIFLSISLAGPEGSI